MQAVTAWLDGEVPAGPYGAYRVVVGVVALLLGVLTCLRLLAVAQPRVVDVPALDGLPAVTPTGVLVLLAVWTSAALFLVVGVAGRVPAAVVATSAVTAAVWDVQTLSNHQTLLVAVTVLLALGPSTAAWSLDARRRGSRTTVPAWPVLLLRTQVSTLYAFTALAKLTPSFLDGSVLRADAPALVALVDSAPVDVVPLLAWATVATELFLAVGLWLRATRRVAIALGLVLHTSILLALPGLLLELLPFALLTVGTYLLFLVDPVTEPQRSGNSASSSSSSAAR